ncbi:Ig-like domain-containing protein [Planctomycetota bacterium]
MKTRLVLLSGSAILIMIVLAAVIISSVNHPPTAETNSVTTKEDTPVAVALAGTDRNGDEFTYSVMTDPAHGRLSGAAPNLTYSPHENYTGPDSFTFMVNDGKKDSDPAMVLIMVTSVNDLPTANDDSATVQEDAPIVTIDVLANDTDADADRLMVINATQGRYGSVTISTNGTLTYTPGKNFSGSDTFSYTLSDGKGGTDTAAVEVTVNADNDAPKITSRPSKTTRVWALYTYDVEAKDPDPQDTLVYSLIARPDGMTINPATGLIEWRPTSAQAGTYDVQIKVADSNSVPVADTQSFALKVTSLESPLTATLTVVDCFSREGEERISLKDKISVVQSSDGRRLQTGPRSNTVYCFSNPSIPTGARIKSVVIYVEHFEDAGFPQGKLEWLAGTGFSAEPEIWASVAAPIRQGQAEKATDSWDVTSAVERAEKANSLQLQVRAGKKNEPCFHSTPSSGRMTSIDLVYAVVEWY